MSKAHDSNSGHRMGKTGRRNGTGKVRIIAGEWRGHRISVLARPQLRPTPDRLRETLFSWIGDAIKESRVLDLFAGTGALGFESLSRGAASATFIENDQRTLSRLRESCHQFDLSAEQAQVVDANAMTWLHQNDKTWDLVFVDPPFEETRYYKRVLESIASRLAGEGMVYVESAVRADPIECELDEWKCKSVGEVRIQLFRNSTPS